MTGFDGSSLRGAILAPFRAQGSTRTAAIIRVFMVFLLWTSLAIPASPFRWLDRPWLALACAIFYVFTVTLLVGLFARVSAVLVGLSAFSICWYFGAIQGVQQFRGSTGLWQAALLLMFLPVGGSLSLDRWFRLRRARRRERPLPQECGPTWGLLMVRVQMSAIYCFAALDKIDAQWLAGERLERLAINYYGYAELLHDMPWIHSLCVLAAWFTTFTEFSLGVLIWIRPLRRYVLLLGVVLHLSFFVTIALWPLSQRMILLYLAFLNPDVVHRWIDRLLDRPPDQPPATEPAP